MLIVSLEVPTIPIKTPPLLLRQLSHPLKIFLFWVPPRGVATPLNFDFSCNPLSLEKVFLISNSKNWKWKNKNISHKEILKCWLNLIPHHTSIQAHLLHPLYVTTWVFLAKKSCSKIDEKYPTSNEKTPIPSELAHPSPNPVKLKFC